MNAQLLGSVPYPIGDHGPERVRGHAVRHDHESEIGPIRSGGLDVCS